MYKGSILGNKHLSIQSIYHETILLTTSSALSFIIYACGTILGGIVTDNDLWTFNFNHLIM